MVGAQPANRQSFLLLLSLFWRSSGKRSFGSIWILQLEERHNEREGIECPQCFTATC